MKKYKIILIFLFFATLLGCIKDFRPYTDVYKEVMVIEGLLTDQPGPYHVKLRIATPLWKQIPPSSVTGCKVSVIDDQGNVYPFRATRQYGVYASDSATFRGIAGRTYSLRVETNQDLGLLIYESHPEKMIEVPELDSVYYRKKTMPGSPVIEGCDIFLDTEAEIDECRFFRFEYDETWEFRFPFKNNSKTCWTTHRSEDIAIKSTKGFSENSIKNLPLLSINDPVDRLSIKYSVVVSQFSLSEEEFVYWERLKNSVDQTGGLYDIIPAVVPNNLICVDDSLKKVLGYFSVSSVSSKRLFIKEKFAGSNADYSYRKCLTDTVFTNFPDTIPGYGTALWVLEDHMDQKPPWVVCTRNNGCYFCEVRGTSIKPGFWDDDLKK
jgi:hypothetical protein